jgi:hypothetical protein
MVAPTCVLVFSGKENIVAAHMVDHSYVCAVRADNLLMLTDLSERVTLALPTLAPHPELAHEALLMLAAKFVIVPVEVAQLPITP